MTRLLLPIILIAISVTGFFTFTSPLYKNISNLKSQLVSFDEALSNSKALESERDKLTQKYNTISTENLTKLSKLLPESVDNIRLILEIESIAAPYGMVLKDIKYQADDGSNTSETESFAQSRNSGSVSQSRTDYGTWNLEFSTTGTYNNFINFLRDVESNLRIVDVTSINFTSDVGRGGEESDLYKYTFAIKTYWLKN